GLPGGAGASRASVTPASALCESLPLVMSLACAQIGLSPGEALSAVTVNAAHVLGRAGVGARIGRLKSGYGADVTLLAAPDWRHAAYHVGGDLVAAVVRAGRLEYRR